MKTLVAGYGYISSDEDVAAWGADAIINSPEDILLHL
jgi:phosphoglycolate phosphatase-like HAD superfamily hydrolase